MGISREAVLGHVRDIKEGILLFSPAAGFEPLRLLSAQGIEEVEL